MSESPYVPFYTSDFLGGTSGMTAATKGVYITLLCMMYESEGPLQQKWETLARRCGCTLPAFKRAVSDLLDDGKVDVVDDGIWSEKCDKHITHRRERSGSARSAAKKRWEKNEQKQAKGNANASSAQCQPEPEPEEGTNVPSISKPKKKPVSRKVRIAEDAVCTDAFLSIGADAGHTVAETQAQFIKFRDYAVANGKTYVRWDTAFRNWFKSEFFHPITGGNYDSRNDKRSAPRNGGRSAPTDGFFAGFNEYANQDGGRVEGDFNDAGTIDGTCQPTMDFGACDDGSGPILRVVGSG